MEQRDNSIAITGVTGQVGGEVAAQLAGENPILLARSPERVQGVPPEQLREFDYAQPPQQLARALAGVDTLLLVSGTESADRRDLHRNVIEAARSAGVQHVVYTSFVGAAADSTFTLARDHGWTEDLIRDSGLSYTFLRDNFYLDVLPLFADDQGAIRGPAGDGRTAAVARRDVAEVAAAILRDPAAHRQQVYQLTGPEALSLAEVAAAASQVLGRELRFVDESEEEAYAWRREQYGAPQWQLDAWVSTYTAIRDGLLAEVTPDVERITGHPARSLEQVLTADWLR